MANGLERLGMVERVERVKRGRAERKEQRRRWSGPMGVEGWNGGVEDGQGTGWAEQVGSVERSVWAGKTLVMVKSVGR